MSQTNQFEFNKLYTNPCKETYLHIIQPITQIQLWKVMLAIFTICFDGCLMVNLFSDTVSQLPCGYLIVKVARLVYEQIIFKFAGWLSLYVLAMAYFCYEYVRDYRKINKDQDSLEYRKNKEV